MNCIDSDTANPEIDIAHSVSQLRNLSQTHPLLSLQIFDGSVDLVRQRQSGAFPRPSLLLRSSDSRHYSQPIEAYAIAFARAVSCKRLLLGRWALDLRFLESICPPPGQTERPVGDKILLIEPVAGQYVPPQIRRCGLRFIRMSGVIRSHPVQAGDSVSATPQLNFRKVRGLPVWLKGSCCD